MFYLYLKIFHQYLKLFLQLKIKLKEITKISNFLTEINIILNNEIHEQV